MVVERGIDGVGIGYVVILVEKWMGEGIVEFMMENRIDFWGVGCGLLSEKVEGVGIVVGKFGEVVFGKVRRVDG